MRNSKLCLLFHSVEIGLQFLAVRCKTRQLAPIEWDDILLPLKWIFTKQWLLNCLRVEEVRYTQQAVLAVRGTVVSESAVSMKRYKATTFSYRFGLFLGYFLCTRVGQIHFPDVADGK
jgi:hypothetical protein